MRFVHEAVEGVDDVVRCLSYCDLSFVSHDRFPYAVCQRLAGLLRLPYQVTNTLLVSGRRSGPGMPSEIYCTHMAHDFEIALKAHELETDTILSGFSMCPQLDAASSSPTTNPCHAA